MNIAANSLEVKVPITFFKDEKAQTKREIDLSLRELKALHESSEYPSKAESPWFSLVHFGDNPSEKKCLRWSGNVEGFSGVVIDYDGGPLSKQEIESRFREHSINVLVKPSSSCTEDNTRCHLIFPLSRRLPANEFTKMVARANGILSGYAAPESFTITQGFHIGRVAGGSKVDCTIIDGDFIDLRDDLDATALYKTGKSSAVSLAEPVDPEDLKSPFPEMLEEKVALIEKQNDDYPEFVENMHAFKGCGISKEAWLDYALKNPDYDDDIANLDGRWDGCVPLYSGHRQVCALLERHGINVDDYWQEVARGCFEADGEPPPEPKPRRRYTPRPATTFQIDRRPDLVEGIAKPAQTGFVAGAPNSGKSLAMGDLACSICHGIPWLGRKVQQGRVALLALESPSGIANRVIAWHKHVALPLSPNFHMVDEAFNFGDRNDCDDFLSAMLALKDENGIPLRLIIIDTLSAAAARLDENSAGDMAAVISFMQLLARKTGAFVLAVHHTTKSNPGEMRGSGALGGNSDVTLLVEENGGLCTITGRKLRDDAKAGAKLAFRIEAVDLGERDDGTRITAPVAVQADARDVQSVKALPAAQRDVLTILEDGGGEMPKADIRAAYIRRSAKDPDAARMTCNRSLESLQRRGRIVIDGDVVRLPEGSSLAEMIAEDASQAGGKAQ